MNRKLLTSLLLLPLFTFAQSYTFSVAQETYSRLDDDKILVSAPGSMRNFLSAYFEMPFPFYSFGQQIDSAVMYSKGVIALFNNTTAMGLSACAAEIGERYAKNPELYASYMALKIEGDNGQRILKLEYDNVGFAYTGIHDSSNFFNAQVWLYEGSDVIEYRYGPHNITNPKWFGQYTGLFASLDSADNSALFNITGNPASPVISTNNDLNLSGFPASGTVYRFSPAWGSHTGVKETYTASDFNIYPNPANQIVTIKLKESNSSLLKVVLTDLQGREIKTVNVETDVFSLQLSVNDVPAGIYFIKTETASGTAMRKLLVE
jgi:hypothetical protein